VSSTTVSGENKRASKEAVFALRVYSDRIMPCFKNATERAEALGLSKPAIHKWERGELAFVKGRSLNRALLIGVTCERLAPSFRRKCDVGEYLLHPTVGGLRPLDLVVESGDPGAAVELLEATRSTVVRVAKRHLPPEAFTEDAWAELLAAPTTDGERAFEDELLARADEHGVSAVL
jgi:hypothetical protein